MVRRIAVTGVEEYDNYEELEWYLSLSLVRLSVFDDIIFVSGGGKGAEALAERYAKENFYELEVVKTKKRFSKKMAKKEKYKMLLEKADGFIFFGGIPAHEDFEFFRAIIRSQKSLRIVPVEIK